MDRAKKKFASAIDGLRSLHNRTEINIDEKVQPEYCRLTTVVRHGLPDDPRCIAFDPVQRLMAIGTGRGHVRIIGESGVDYLFKHETQDAVLHMAFLINEGGLITACNNDIIHLWNYRQKVAEIVHSIQLNKEAVTAINLPISSKWLYVGTDKGNVYFLCLATFSLSSYVIMWNKAIDLSCRVHPGPVRQIAVCPNDASKIIITYDKGICVNWNLATREVDRFPLDPPIKSVSYHYDGRQLLTGNVDGSCCIYNMKKTAEMVQRTTPHGTGSCRPIHQIEWKHVNDTESLVMFSGGMPTDDGLPVPALTVLRGGKSATVLEMDWPILQFIPLPQVIWNTIPQQPHAVAVLLKHDFMILDITQQGHPMIESPHAMNIHESPVTCLTYYSDVPCDLIGVLTIIGGKQRKTDYSPKPWPVSGGLGRECATGHQEIVLTGHKDGTVRFWQETGEVLTLLYRLKTSSHFERLEEMEASDKVSHSVKSIELCLESRQLLVAGNSGQVTLFRFMKQESTNTISVVNIPLLGNASTSNNYDYDKSPVPNGPGKEMRRQRKVVSRESTNSLDTSDSGDERIVPFKVRGAPVKRMPGYVPELACFVPWPSHSKVDQITSIALNSCYGVIAIGTTSGLALVDTTQCALIYAWTTNELYGSEPTPAIQLSMQLSDAPSPVEYDEYDDDILVYNSTNGQYTMRTTSENLGNHRKSLTPNQTNGFLNPGELPMRPKSANAHVKSPGGVMGILRRNTAELAASIRDKYHGGSKHDGGGQSTDRPDIEHRGDTPPPTPNEGVKVTPKTNRSHSVKGSFIRRFAKSGSKKETKMEEKEVIPSIERSRSFHSHISEEGKYCNSPISLDAPKRIVPDQKQRSFDARRPQLFKTQSVVENGSLSRGESQRDSPSLGRQNNNNTSSPSTSSQSLERSISAVPQESITSLTFIHSHSKRNDPKTAPCLWVGTSAGTSLALNLILPEDRFTSTVVVAPSGTIVKLKGQVLYQGFMDSSFCVISAAAESYKDSVKENSVSSPERSVINRVSTKASLAPQYSSSIDVNDEISQILVVVAEMEVKIVALPTFSQLFVYKCEDIPLVKAQTTHIRGHPVLMCLSAAGQIVLLSLPSLRLLNTSPLFPHSVDIYDSICQKTSFSDHGLGVYMASQSEMEKYTVCAELAEQTNDSLGELFIPCEMPEAPKNNSFLKGVSSIFGAQRQDSVDIDAILSDKGDGKSSVSATTMRSVARTIPGPSMSMDRAQAGGVSAGQAAAMALQNLNERSEKLNATVDATENLKNNAMNLSSRTGKLVEKYEKKKWYNF